jgi:hypothetical protein
MQDLMSDSLGENASGICHNLMIIKGNYFPEKSQNDELGHRPLSAQPLQ